MLDSGRLTFRCASAPIGRVLESPFGVDGGFGTSSSCVGRMLGNGRFSVGIVGVTVDPALGTSSDVGLGIVTFLDGILGKACFMLGERQSLTQG